jgi:hypothetical protein
MCVPGSEDQSPSVGAILETDSHFIQHYNIPNSRKERRETIVFSTTLRHNNTSVQDIIITASAAKNEEQLMLLGGIFEIRLSLLHLADSRHYDITTHDHDYICFLFIQHPRSLLISY